MDGKWKCESGKHKSRASASAFASAFFGSMQKGSGKGGGRGTGLNTRRSQIANGGGAGMTLAPVSFCRQGRGLVGADPVGAGGLTCHSRRSRCRTNRNRRRSRP
jgi:hypothetical protein